MTDFTDTTVDDIVRELSHMAGRALHAARQAIERHQHRSAQERDQARREREHRLRMFETQLRTTRLQRQLATREGHHQLADDLAAVEADQRRTELMCRWAAADADRHTDPGLADAWTARLREAGISPEEARAYADELWARDAVFEDLDDLSPDRQAADHAEMAADLRDKTSAVESLDAEGAETARLIELAQPAALGLGPATPAAFHIPIPEQTVDVEHVAQL